MGTRRRAPGPDPASALAADAVVEAAAKHAALAEALIALAPTAFFGAACRACGLFLGDVSGFFCHICPRITGE